MAPFAAQRAMLAVAQTTQRAVPRAPVVYAQELVLELVVLAIVAQVQDRATVPIPVECT
jgi:hypothetical protein